jgi:hypothetical protein
MTTQQQEEAMKQAEADKFRMFSAVMQAAHEVLFIHWLTLLLFLFLSFYVPSSRFVITRSNVFVRCSWSVLHAYLSPASILVCRVLHPRLTHTTSHHFYLFHRFRHF